jgi:CheY-like chemotaxis protein
VLLRMLDRLGYHADLATNGLEAVESVQSHRYDVIFMDVQMPVMDGLEATRQIRSIDGILPKRPYVIAMTAAATEADHDNCMQAGMDDFVTKPANVEMLVHALERSTNVASLTG